MLGKIVIYTLTAADADQINRRRTTGASIAARVKLQDGTDRLRWPIGAQAHIGTEAKEGDRFPMLITKVQYASVNGQVFLDGTDVLWVQKTSGCLLGEGGIPGQWEWPE